MPNTILDDYEITNVDKAKELLTELRTNISDLLNQLSTANEEYKLLREAVKEKFGFVPKIGD